MKINPFRRVRLACLTCALCLAIPLPAMPQEFGRLFFPPERRQALDRQRESSLVERREIVVEDPALTIDGVVTRSSGWRTVWINGVAHDGDGLSVTPNRAKPGRIVVRTQDGLDAEAGVGDTIDRKTGETAGILGDGQIRIEPLPRR